LMDLLFIALVVGFVVLSGWLMAGLERL
jgi:hypothetical protein